jgi:hypothetical protein
MDLSDELQDPVALPLGRTPGTHLIGTGEQSKIFMPLAEWERQLFSLQSGTN